MELAKDWRTDKYLRHLEALLVVASADDMLMLSGTGDVIEPEDGVLYKDIGHRKGFCFYDARSSQGVRMLFMGNRVVALCITRKGK